MIHVRQPTPFSPLRWECPSSFNLSDLLLLGRCCGAFCLCEGDQSSHCSHVHLQFSPASPVFSCI